MGAKKPPASIEAENVERIDAVLSKLTDVLDDLQRTLSKKQNTPKVLAVAKRVFADIHQQIDHIRRADADLANIKVGLQALEERLRIVTEHCILVASGADESMFVDSMTPLGKTIDEIIGIPDDGVLPRRFIDSNDLARTTVFNVSNNEYAEFLRTVRELIGEIRTIVNQAEKPDITEPVRAGVGTTLAARPSDRLPASDVRAGRFGISAALQGILPRLGLSGRGNSGDPKIPAAEVEATTERLAELPGALAKAGEAHVAAAGDVASPPASQIVDQTENARTTVEHPSLEEMHSQCTKWHRRVLANKAAPREIEEAVAALHDALGKSRDLLEIQALYDKAQSAMERFDPAFPDAASVTIGISHPSFSDQEVPSFLRRDKDRHPTEFAPLANQSSPSHDAPISVDVATGQSIVGTVSISAEATDRVAFNQTVTKLLGEIAGWSAKYKHDTEKLSDDLATAQAALETERAANEKVVHDLGITIRSIREQLLAEGEAHATERDALAAAHTAERDKLLTKLDAANERIQSLSRPVAASKMGPLDQLRIAEATKDAAERHRLQGLQTLVDDLRKELVIYSERRTHELGQLKHRHARQMNGKDVSHAEALRLHEEHLTELNTQLFQMCERTFSAEQRVAHLEQGLAKLRQQQAADLDAYLTQIGEAWQNLADTDARWRAAHDADAAHIADLEHGRTEDGHTISNLQRDIVRRDALIADRNEQIQHLHMRTQQVEGVLSVIGQLINRTPGEDWQAALERYRRIARLQQIGEMARSAQDAPASNEESAVEDARLRAELLAAVRAVHAVVPELKNRTFDEQSSLRELFTIYQNGVDLIAQRDTASRSAIEKALVDILGADNGLTLYDGSGIGVRLNQLAHLVQDLQADKSEAEQSLEKLQRENASARDAALKILRACQDMYPDLESGVDVDAPLLGLIDAVNRYVSEMRSDASQSTALKVELKNLLGWDPDGGESLEKALARYRGAGTDDGLVTDGTAIADFDALEHVESDLLNQVTDDDVSRILRPWPDLVREPDTDERLGTELLSPSTQEMVHAFFQVAPSQTNALLLALDAKNTLAGRRIFATQMQTFVDWFTGVDTAQSFPTLRRAYARDLREQQKGCDALPWTPPGTYNLNWRANSSKLQSALQELQPLASVYAASDEMAQLLIDTLHTLHAQHSNATIVDTTESEHPVMFGDVLDALRLSVEKARGLRSDTSSDTPVSSSMTSLFTRQDAELRDVLTHIEHTLADYVEQRGVTPRVPKIKKPIHTPETIKPTPAPERAPVWTNSLSGMGSATRAAVGSTPSVAVAAQALDESSHIVADDSVAIQAPSQAEAIVPLSDMSVGHDAVVEPPNSVDGHLASPVSVADGVDRHAAPEAASSSMEVIMQREREALKQWGVLEVPPLPETVMTLKGPEPIAEFIERMRTLGFEPHFLPKGDIPISWMTIYNLSHDYPEEIFKLYGPDVLTLPGKWVFVETNNDFSPNRSNDPFAATMQDFQNRYRRGERYSDCLRCLGQGELNRYRSGLIELFADQLGLAPQQIHFEKMAEFFALFRLHYPYRNITHEDSIAHWCDNPCLTQENGRPVVAFPTVYGRGMPSSQNMTFRVNDSRNNLGTFRVVIDPFALSATQS